MKTVDHSYEQALIMYDNVHIHVIMNIIVTPTKIARLEDWPGHPPHPNPGTLVDLTTKTRNCDLQHFDDKSA